MNHVSRNAFKKIHPSIFRKNNASALSSLQHIGFGLIKGSTHTIQKSYLSLEAVNTKMEFPCIERLESREQELSQKKDVSEELYLDIVHGYEVFRHNKPFPLSHGGILPSIKIAYETWGTLNSDGSNAILLHTGLSASSHAKSHPKNTKPGWWEDFIGPGLSIDTNKYFVICTNVIGGCYGSTGPSSINELTGKRYASSFPILTVNDMVRAQFLLLDHLKINKLHASVGSSMGGMQSLAAASISPERVGRLVSISACALSHPYSIALRFAQRQVLMTDPNFNRGHYYDSVPPHVGMKLARQISTVTYRSGPEWELRFGRSRSRPASTPALCPDFLVETYIDHKSESFCLQYDANSLLYISKAMDMFDISKSNTDRLNSGLKMAMNKINHIESGKKSSGTSVEDPLSSAYPLDLANIPENHDLKPEPTSSSASTQSQETREQITQDLIAGVSNIRMPTLVLGVQTDILFPSTQQKEIASILRSSGNKQVTYYEIDSIYGHDTFLIDRVNVGAAIKGHLELQ
ncbi:putative serine-O-acetyltransferase cys2 [Smittium mucronatum]|uniref:Putative serine-O-acetyltransferase cys2 n=1 Tax=Smittium mucronatum TaxID=133383 RepID=A0A1R0GMI3_9FUNG|nr:putative serine-O-acetyltransferase cys2 [Smittium mucronatum]